MPGRSCRLVDALALGTFPAESLAAPITAAQADANAARAELDALDAPAEVPTREQALAMLGNPVGDILAEDRSPELLHEFDTSVGLSLTWDHCPAADRETRSCPCGSRSHPSSWLIHRG